MDDFGVVVCRSQSRPNSTLSVVADTVRLMEPFLTEWSRTLPEGTVLGFLSGDRYIKEFDRYCSHLIYIIVPLPESYLHAFLFPTCKMAYSFLEQMPENYNRKSAILSMQSNISLALS